jgi:hypothetical protein
MITTATQDQPTTKAKPKTKIPALCHPDESGQLHTLPASPSFRILASDAVQKRT